MATKKNGNDQTIKGSANRLVYDTLLLHEYQKRNTLLKKTGLGTSSLSAALTYLRRRGLAEYSGAGRDKSWKKHKIDNPLYPPQEDIVHRNTKNKITGTDVDPVHEAIAGIRTRLAFLEKELDDYAKLKKSLANYLDGKT